MDNKNGNASLAFAEGATLTFTDNSSTADKVLIVPEASNPDNDAPTVENNSENIQLDTDENGNLVVHTHQAVHVQAKAAPAQKTVISNTGIALTVADTSAMQH